MALRVGRLAPATGTPGSAGEGRPGKRDGFSAMADEKSIMEARTELGAGEIFQAGDAEIFRILGHAIREKAEAM